MSKKKTKQIESLDDLSFDQHNANKGTALGQTMVDQSIERYGAGRSIVADKHGVVIGGNKTLKAAREAGLDVQVVRTTGDQLIVHQRDDLDLNDGSDARMLAYTDNRASEAGLEWDADVILEDITAGLDLDGVFDATTLEDIGVELPGGDEQPEPEAQMDAAEELQEKWKVKDGDVWEIGEHRLMCGDNSDAINFMGKKSADMVFTDPPYNIDYGNIKHSKFKVRNIQNDNMSSDDFKLFCANFTKIIELITDGCVYVCGAPGCDGRTMFVELDNTLHNSTVIIWNKDTFTLGRGKYQNKYEPIWFGWVDKGSSFSDKRDLSNVWDVVRPKSSKEHPTMKPVDLVCRAIADASNVGDIVADIFLGSGTTMVAAEQLNRKCYGMEIEPKYCAVILERMSDMGLTPELISNAREA